MKQVILIISVLCAALSLKAQVVLNEMQSSNSTTHSDEFGEFDDWIELRNIGSQPVDVGGWVLKDQLDTWMIPITNAATFMAPGGYLLMWADDQEAQGMFHANFKLSAANGEFLGLYAPDSISMVDSLTIPPLNADQSFGWCQTGLEVFEVPTPLAENNCSVGLIESDKEESIKVWYDSYSRAMQFSGIEVGPYSVTISDIKGSAVVDFPLRSGQTSKSVSELTAGSYLVTIKADGTSVSRKFSVQ